MSEIYNYSSAVTEDVKSYILENYSKEEILEKLEDRESWEEHLHDDLWAEDYVTGNGSGSYTFNRFQAGLNLAGNFDELVDAVEEFGGDFEELLRQGEEACDVTLRCYYLDEAISKALDEIEFEYSEVKE